MIDLHPLWHALEQHLLKSIPEYTAILGLLAVAVIANMPNPETFRKFIEKPSFKEYLAISYKWCFDSLQAFMATRRPAPPLPAIPIKKASRETKAPHESER